jgi:hypothetical protein
LQDHLLARLLNLPFDGDEQRFTTAQPNTIVFLGGKIYSHKTLAINYTTYDLRRAQDSINTRTRADIMVLACEDLDDHTSHPYWYGRVIGIYHANVKHIGTDSRSSQTKKMDFVWVRWFQRNNANRYRDGWKARALPRIEFTPYDGELDAFGFLDPNLIIRGVHVIPAFAYDRTGQLLPPSIARLPEEKDKDWLMYYVNM